MELHLLAATDHQAQAGARLRQIIDAVGIKQIEAARIMGISKSNLGNWIRGDAPCTAYALYRLQRVTGVTPDWIILGDPSGLPQRLASVLTAAPTLAHEPQPVA